MQYKTTIEIHMQSDQEITHPDLLLHRLSNMLLGNTVRLPAGQFDFQEIEVWATTVLSGVEHL